MEIPTATPSPSFHRNDRRVINGWAMFDWANSAFALVITVAIFPPYFLEVTDETVRLLGLSMSNSSLYAFAISFAYLLIASVSPWLSGMADYSGRKKLFLKIFTTIGSVGCLSLLWFHGMSTLWVGVAGFVLAMIGFAGGLVFYNSYLPDIVTEDLYDRVSAKGFAFGYVGSVLLLIINLVMLLKPEIFGLPSEGTLPARIAFFMVGIWWIGFAQIPFRRLPPDQKKGRPSASLARQGWKELMKVWRAVRQSTQIKRFLLSFFCYSMGVQTVLFLAATFAEKELAFATSELIIVVLILQLVAIVGAYVFAWVSDRYGNKLSLAVMLVIWTVICVVAYFVQDKMQFYAIASAVGLVMGGIQSLSRSTYSKLLPKETEDTTSYFSFYDVLEKVAIVLGTFIFGLAELITGNIRNSVLVLGAFFVISLIILLRIRIEHSRTRPIPA
ncbi:MAG: MFS transporter [Lewinella sp.]|nr:MFS transporter [Lewinella sp.]